MRILTLLKVKTRSGIAVQLCQNTDEYFFTPTGEGFLRFVPRRNTVTLLPLIIRHIQHGSRIYSDFWQAYNRINDIRSLIGGQVRRRYVHMGVNHSQHFVNPQTGVCTNHVEVRMIS